MRRRHPVLPDYLRTGLRVLFVGINPGLRSATLSHHFAGHSNRFWKLLYDARLVDEPLTYVDDARLTTWGIGLTNLIERPTAGVEALSPVEFEAGREALEQKIRRYRPRIVALLGITIYRKLFGHTLAPAETPPVGRTPAVLGGRPVYLLPNPSGRNACYSYQRLVSAYCELARTVGPPARP